MWSSSCVSSVFLLPQFFLWMWIVFFLISPSEMSWTIALLLVQKPIAFDGATVYLREEKEGRKELCSAIHIQRKNCGSRNTEEKQLLDHMV